MAMSNPAPQPKSTTDDERDRPDARSTAGANTRAERLIEANINPRTGLATDYSESFQRSHHAARNDPDIPECVDDFLGWRPLSYREHFTASGFSARELAISAYDSSDPAIRAEFDNITTTMTSILTTVGTAMRQAKHTETRVVLAEQAAGWVKPLVTLAGAVINGGNNAGDVDLIMNQ